MLFLNVIQEPCLIMQAETVMSSLNEAGDALDLNRQLQRRLQDMLEEVERMQVSLVILLVVENSSNLTN